MTTMTAQQLWPRFAALIHTAMSTDYSSKIFASDLSDILAGIENQCPDIDKDIIDKLEAAKEWAEAGHSDQPSPNFFEAYTEIAKKYIELLYEDLYNSPANPRLSSKIKPKVQYAVELINIRLQGDMYGFDHESLLRHGVEQLELDEKNELKGYCNDILDIDSDKARKFFADTMKLSLSTVKASFKDLLRVFPLIFFVVLTQFH
jgi:hypothetical protein